jgi:hypothetical protein
LGMTDGPHLSLAAARDSGDGLAAEWKLGRLGRAKKLSHDGAAG